MVGDQQTALADQEFEIETFTAPVLITGGSKLAA
jgi:hypothetical protein